VPINVLAFMNRIVSSTLWLFLAGFSLIVPPEDELRAQTNTAGSINRATRVTLERILYLTNNLDSLTRHFVKDGFEVRSCEYDLSGVQRNEVDLLCGQVVELESLVPSDTSDWRWKAIAAYGTHVCGVVLHVADASQLAQALDSLSIPHGSIQTYNRETAFGLDSPMPLDISFASCDSAVLQKTAPLSENRFSRISWLLLTASPKSEAMLRRVFSALGLKEGHEGCCDYWMIGPPENRVGVRFELPSTTFFSSGDWLSIEPGGVVFAY
jgi:hypothetical protein